MVKVYLESFLNDLLLTIITNIMENKNLYMIMNKKQKKQLQNS